MKNIRTVFAKEIRRFFTDKRMLAALFLPGILIAILYTCMGNIFTNSSALSTEVSNITYVIAYSDNSGLPKPSLLLDFEDYTKVAEPTNKIEYHTFALADLETEKNKVKDGTYDVMIAFSDDFETKVQTEKGNHLDMYYYGSSKKASNAYLLLSALIRTTYDNYQVNVDSKGLPITPNLAPSEYVGSQLISILFPMITVSLLFSTVVSICPDAVAGEKERGTLAAMLLTPIKRKELALGKALALLCTSLASGAVSFLGLVISLPRLMSGLSFSIGALEYTLLGLLIITTLTFFVGTGMLVSTLTKSTKEASSYLGPLTVVFMALAIMTAFVDTSSIGFAFVPFLNITSCMSAVLKGSISVPFFAITIGMSALETFALMFAATRLFSSERIMIK